MKDNTLLFEVKGQYIVRLDSIEPVAKCRNLYKAQFQFKTDEWTGTKTALFVQGKHSKSVILDENGVCEIPWEFFDSDNTTFGYVSVYCGDLVTANRVVVDIVKSGYQESDASVPPSPDVYQQLVELAEDTKEIAQSVRDDADARKFDGEEGYSPKVSLTEELDGVTVTVQNKDGQQSAKVKNGKDGKPGKDGDPGITPHIGENENWYIGDMDTGKPSRGLRGENATDKQVRTAVDAYMEENPVAITVDPTLTQDGQAADAKATGDKILQYAIKNTASGEGILRITDSADEKLQDIKLYGKSEQLSTTGKNLFDFSNLESGRININTGALEEHNHTRRLADYIDITDITSFSVYLPGYNKANGAVYVVIHYYDKDKKYLSYRACGDNFEKYENIAPVENAVYIKVTLEQVTIDNPQNIFKVQLEKGAKSTDYEPYTGGQPSPSVEYPQEIVSAGKYDEVSGKYLLDVEVTGKNLFNPKSTEYVQKTYRSYKVNKKKGISYITITLIDKENNADISGVSLGFSGDDTSATTGLTWLVSSTSIIKTKTTTAKYITIYPPRDEILEKILNRFDIQVEYGEEATEYEQYKEPQTITLQTPNGLPGIKVTSGGNYTDENGQQWICDEIDLKRGKYVRYNNEYVITGNESIFLSESDGEPDEFSIGISNAYNVLKNIMPYSICICTNSLFRDDGIRTPNTCSVAYEVMYLRFEKGKYTVDTLKTKLKELHDGSNPVKVLYPNRDRDGYLNPIETDLTPEEIEAYKALHTYYPTTVMSNSEDCEMEVTYVCDTKTYIDNKFKELQQATISTNLEMLERRYEVIL